MLLLGARGAAIERALGDAELAAPDLLNAEVVHAFRRMESAGLVSADAAAAAMTDLADAPIERLTTSHLAGRVWAYRHNLTAYDATYVALAHDLGWPLVTADARIGGAPDLGVEIVPVAGL